MKIPEWVPATSWFAAAAAVSATFYFLEQKSVPGVAIAGSFSAGLAIASVVLHRRHGLDAIRPNRRWGLREVLAYVWEYPRKGGQHKSWATKESRVILGDIPSAAQHPGLGIAIVTTELAQVAFGEAAATRLDGVVSWALERCEPQPPYRMLAEHQNPISGIEAHKEPDLRHTMALAIVLLRTERELTRAAVHLTLALNAQKSNGAWVPPDPASDSTVFTTLYGVELVDLALRTRHLRPIDRSRLRHARIGGLKWLMDHQKFPGLWSTDVFTTEPWDCAMATGWVLHRPLQSPVALRSRWNDCVDTAVDKVIDLAESPQTWVGCSEDRRFRVEARVAGGVRRALQRGCCSAVVMRRAKGYLDRWRKRAPTSLARLDTIELDVGTATFAAWAMADAAELMRVGRIVAAE
jgi:hypothetical protein